MTKTEGANIPSGCLTNYNWNNKIYEDEYCSRCEDYKGCLGLIDSMAADMDTQDSKKPGYETLDNATRGMINNALKVWEV